MSEYESFERGEPLGAETRLLPAAEYNAMHLLLEASGRSCVFVPVRSMQYMAVIDREEVIFVDIQQKNAMEFAWRDFHPQRRQALTEPVEYTFEYYKPQALVTMKRAQGEFFAHVKLMAARLRQSRAHGDADVIHFPGSG